MRNFPNRLIIILMLAFAGPSLSSAQDIPNKELDFEVNRIYLPLSISKETLSKANELADLNRHYKPSWVKKYISVEILTIHNGKKRKAVTENDILSQEQKENMKMADVGQNIEVNVQYIPDNTLSFNELKENNFTFTVFPVNEAQYSKGKDQLNQYLKEKAIDKIPNGIFVNYGMAAVKFTVNEDGEIGNVHVFESSNDEKVDELLLRAIHNMECWIPAEYTNGVKIKQEFALIVGNMENCMINLLNIDKGAVARND